MATVRAAALTPLVFVFMSAARFRQRPYNLYRRLRKYDPVHQSPFGLVVLTRHEDVTTLLRHPAVSVEERKADASTDNTGVARKLLRRDAETLDNGPFFDLTHRVMLFRDPPDHTRLRSLVSKAFTPKRTEALTDRVQRIVDEMIDELAPRGRMDLVHDFAYPLPAYVICELLRVPATDADFIIAQSRPVATGFDPGPMRTREAAAAAHDAAAALTEYLERLIEQRRAAPGTDLMSSLIEAEEDGDRLTHDELIATIFLLLMAGHETTANLIGNGIDALLRHPDQLRMLREDPSLDSSAVEELLRFDSPVQMTQRITLDEVTFGSVTIPAGRIVVAMLAAANHDPAVFADPERLDLSRTPNPHIAFGSGPHFCIGAALARLEARVAIGTLVRRLPALRAGGESQRRPSFTIRGFDTLPIAWTPQPAPATTG